jgi:hypothetical protein
MASKLKTDMKIGTGKDGSGSVLGRNSKSIEANGPSKSKTKSDVSVASSSGDQTNGDVTAAKGDDQITPKWSKSNTRVKDQIKFIERMNKGSGQASSPRRFGDRSASAKTGEERSSSAASNSASSQGNKENSSSNPPSSISKTTAPSQETSNPSTAVKASLDLKTPKKASAVVNAVISKFEQKEKEVRHDEQLESIHLRRQPSNKLLVSQTASPSVGEPSKKTTSETIKPGEKQELVIIKPTEQEDNQVQNRSCQKLLSGSKVAEETKLPPKPGALPPKSPVLQHRPVSTTPVISIEDKKMDDDLGEDCYEDVSDDDAAEKEVTSKSPLQNLPVPQPPPPTTDPDEEFYDDVDEETTSTVEPGQKASGMRDRPLPVLPEGDIKSDTSPGKAKKGGLFGKLKKIKKKVKDSSPFIKRKGKKSESVSQHPIENDDDDEDALELKEEDELGEVYTPTDENAGKIIEPEENYEDVEPDENTGEGMDSHDQDAGFYDDIEEDEKGPDVGLKPSLPGGSPPKNADTDSINSDEFYENA